jgi:hypothetical protein
MWTILLSKIQQIVNSKLFLYLVIGGLVYFWIVDRKQLRDNISRLETNQIALTTNSSIQQQVYLGEFKKLHSKEDSIAKLIGLKPKDITNVVVNNYHYKDTTIVQVPLIPKDSTSKDTLTFISPIKCGYVSGEVYLKNMTIKIKEVDTKDTLHTFLYENYNRFLGFLWKRNKRYEAVTYSECMNKVINTEENIKIIK